MTFRPARSTICSILWHKRCNTDSYVSSWFVKLNLCALINGGLTYDFVLLVPVVVHCSAWDDERKPCVPKRQLLWWVPEYKVHGLPSSLCLAPWQYVFDSSFANHNPHMIPAYLILLLNMSSAHYCSSVEFQIFDPLKVVVNKRSILV
jgi:hypothetical protein